MTTDTVATSTRATTVVNRGYVLFILTSVAVMNYVDRQRGPHNA